jgi:hypothetical protein
MKTILIIVISLTSIHLCAQERVNESLPVIINKIATLKQASGWVKNDIGKWISSKNAIPSEYHDFKYYSEEFDDYTLYRIKIDTNIYSMLVKTSKNNFTYFVFDTAQQKKFVDSSYFISKSLVCYGEHFLRGRFEVNKMLTEIKSDYKKFFENGYANYVLNVSIKWFPSKNIFRFYFQIDPGIITKYLETETLIDKYFETTDLLFKKFIQEF